jgi:hypothetical protein
VTEPPLARPAMETPVRKVNVKRGMLRVWMLFSVLWAASFIGLSVPVWYHAASYSLRIRGFQVTEATDPKTQATPWLCNLTSDNMRTNACFNVTSPGGCIYFVIADRRVADASVAAAEVAESEKDAPCQHATKGGWGNDPLIVDLTAKNGWTVSKSGLKPYPDLASAKIFTLLAFAVPVGLFVLGAAFGWAATGFKS